MAEIDYDLVYGYVMSRLERELPSNLFYHGIHHTRDIVCPAVDVLGYAEGLSMNDLLLVRVGALFHDLGFVIRYDHNESIGADIAGEILPGYGFSDKQVDVIQQIVMATCLPQRPDNLLEQIMCDADLDHLGQPFFAQTNDDLYRERLAYGKPMEREEWYLDSLHFLRSHQYFTASARRYRNWQKHLNIKHLQDLYEELNEMDEE